MSGEAPGSFENSVMPGLMEMQALRYAPLDTRLREAGRRYGLHLLYWALEKHKCM